MIKTISLIICILLPTFSVAKVSSDNKIIKSINMDGITIDNQITHHAITERQLANELFVWLNKVCKEPNLLTTRNFNKYFDLDVHYSVNGTLLATDIAELEKRLHNLLVITKHMHVVLPFEHLVIANNVAALSYQLKIERLDGTKYTDQVTALIQFKKGKIISWQAVAAHKL